MKRKEFCMRKATGFILFFLLLANLGYTQSKRNLTIDDYFAIRGVSAPQISPDGKNVAYAVRTRDLKQNKSFIDLYVIPFAGGEPIQITSDEFDSAHPRSSPVPRWTPDGKQLSYVAKRGKKKPQIFLWKPNGAIETQLTDLKQYISDFEWSPDGKKILLTLTDPDPDEPGEDSKEEKTPKPIVVTRVQIKSDGTGFLNDLKDHLYMFNTDTKEVKQITSGPHNESGGTWSPNGTKILFSSNRTEDPDINSNSDLFVMPATGGDAQKLTTNPGPDDSATWSPDGKWIAYLTGVEPNLIYYDTSELALIPSSGGEPKFLTRQLDRNIFQPRFGPDGKTIYFLLEDQGTQRLCSYSLKDGSINKKVSTENVLGSYDVNSKGIVYTASRPDLPDEVFTIASKQKAQNQITRVNAAFLSKIQLGKVEPIHFNSKDGSPISGFVVKPPDFNASKKYPLINWIHGGPTSQYTDAFDFTNHLYAANGYVVTLINYRGSTGYGKDFCKAIFADWGNKEVDDLNAGVDYLIAQGYVDPDRLGVGGWSYGGMMTDWSIYKTNRYKAAISGAGSGNALAGYGTDHYQNVYENELGFPWEKIDAWKKLSGPFLGMNKIKTPTLFLCGEVDWNVSLINSEQMYQGLARLGIDTMLIVYPGQSHGISKPSYVKDRYERYLAWYGHFLKGEPNKVPPAAKKEETKVGQ